MDVQAWTFLIVGLTFALYIGIAICRGPVRSASSTSRAGLPARQRHATAGLDERGVVHLDGRDHRLRGDGRLGVPDGMDRRLRAAGPAARAVPAEVRQVHGARLHGGSVRLPGRAAGRGSVCDLRVLHLRRRADARRRRRVQPVPRGGHHVRRDHRHGPRVLLRRPGRHEGDHLHAGRPVLRPDLRLHRSRRLPGLHGDREPDPPGGVGRCGRGRRRTAREARRDAGRSRIHPVHRVRQEPARRGLHHRGPDARDRRPAARHHPLLHGEDRPGACPRPAGPCSSSRSSTPRPPRSRCSPGPTCWRP